MEQLSKGARVRVHRPFEPGSREAIYHGRVGTVWAVPGDRMGPSGRYALREHYALLLDGDEHPCAPFQRDELQVLPT